MKPLFKLILYILGTFTITAHADHLPLWEAGISLASLEVPDYRGSSENSAFNLPVPYITYRGERLRIARGGIKGILFESDKLELNISMFGTLPSKSEDNTARQGMEDLDATLEIGPSLMYLLYLTRNEKTRWELNLPVRSVFATDLTYMQQKGWLFYPHLSFIRQQPPHGRRWRFEVSLGPLFATQEYHQYFFGVDTKDMTADRPQYHASSGYSGTRFLMTYRRYLSDKWIFRTFLQYENLNNATFDDSPLLTEKTTLGGGIMVTWLFSQSKIMVEHD